jgi:hypothetical protein
MSPQFRLIENDMITLYHRLNGLSGLIRLTGLTAQATEMAQAVVMVF